MPAVPDRLAKQHGPEVWHSLEWDILTQHVKRSNAAMLLSQPIVTDHGFFVVIGIDGGVDYIASGKYVGYVSLKIITHLK